MIPKQWLKIDDISTLKDPESTKNDFHVPVQNDVTSLLQLHTHRS